MASQGPILLTAANGRTGRAVLRALAARGARVRVFIREASQFGNLQEIGAAESAVGDLLDAPALSAAAEGASAVLHIGPPMHPDETHITQMLIDAALTHRVERFVYYSVMHPLRREVRHHRLKLDAEERLIESGLTYTILQPARYMQHLAPLWKKVTLEHVHAMPFDVTKTFNVVDLEDLAAAAAIVATQPGHEFATYELAGPEALSQTDMAAILSEVLGAPVRAEKVSLDALEAAARRAGASEDRIEQMKIMNDHYDRFGFRGNPNVLAMLLGRAPTSYRQYVERLASQ